MGEDPGRLSVVKRSVHRRPGGDPGSPVAVQAETLRVVAGLAIGGVCEDVRGVPLDEVCIVEAPGILPGVAPGADLLGVALCAIHEATRGSGTMTRSEVRVMERENDSRRTDAESRFGVCPGKRDDRVARCTSSTGVALFAAGLRVAIGARCNSLHGIRAMCLAPVFLSMRGRRAVTRGASAFE
jgi:hypothetical protein